MTGERLYEQYITNLWYDGFLNNHITNAFRRWKQLRQDERDSWNYIASLKEQQDEK